MCGHTRAQSQPIPARGRCSRSAPRRRPGSRPRSSHSTVPRSRTWTRGWPADHSGLPAAPPAANNIASYLHTGGTTGTPKLAARTHANEVANAWMMRASDILDQDSVIFAALPLFHTNALVVTVLAPLLKGQHVVWGGPLGYRDAPFSRTSGRSSSATASPPCPASRRSTRSSRRYRSTPTSRA